MSKAQPAASILVVDDDPEIVAMLTHAPQRTRGYKVSTASDGHRALELAKRERPDIVLLDVMMPGKSGWEVARALKQDPVTQGIKIVMVTAIGEQVNEITSPLYGADAHIDKPFEFERLEQVIAGLVSVAAEQLASAFARASGSSGRPCRWICRSFCFARIGVRADLARAPRRRAPPRVCSSFSRTTLRGRVRAAAAPRRSRTAWNAELVVLGGQERRARPSARSARACA